MPALDPLPDDFRDFLVELVDASAEFVLVGGWAIALHGRPRATEDLDILVRATPKNAECVYQALATFGVPVAAHGVKRELFAGEGYGYRFGIKPNLIEVLTTISGVDFDAAIADAFRVELEGRLVPVIGRTALLQNKRAAGREKDLDDVKWLLDHPPRTR